MARHRSARRRRSNSRFSGSGATEDRSIGWRTVLLVAPLVYGAGVLAGDLVSVSLFGAPIAVLVSGVLVGVACLLVSAGLARLIGRLERTRPRSIGSIASPRTSIRAGVLVLLPSFLLGLGLATLA